jgi:hypothetical protein
MPILIPPLVKVALLAIGGATVAHWLFREIRRIGRELDDIAAERAGEPLRHRDLPKLRRDPASGEWRPV